MELIGAVIFLVGLVLLGVASVLLGIVWSNRRDKPDGELSGFHGFLVVIGGLIGLFGIFLVVNVLFAR